jgi:hypothetical protein
MIGELKVMELAYHYRACGLQGLQKAINHFSTENSDAVLAASVLLGWQATDEYVQLVRDKLPATHRLYRKSWGTFMHGTLTVY